MPSDLDLLELTPPLADLCPPATVVDKTRYSGFAEPKLLAHLREREADALIISGSETDVCVLATVLSAVDLKFSYSVIVVRDAACSSSDEGHDMLLRLYHSRQAPRRSCRGSGDDQSLPDRSARRMGNECPRPLFSIGVRSCQTHYLRPAAGFKCLKICRTISFSGSNQGPDFRAVSLFHWPSPAAQSL